MKRKGMRCMADGGLVGTAASALKNRDKVLAAAERAASGAPSTPTPATALTPTPSQPARTTQQVLSEAESKAARFKWERENPGKPYPGKADGGPVASSDSTGYSAGNLFSFKNGGYVPFNSNSPFINSTAHSNIVHAPPQLGLQNGLFGGYADGGVIHPGHTPLEEQNGLFDNPGPAKTTWEFPPDGGVRGLGGMPVGYADGGNIPISQGGSITPTPVSPLHNFQRVGAGDLVSMARPDTAGGVTMPAVSPQGIAQMNRPPAAKRMPDRVIQPPSVTGFQYRPSMRSFDPRGQMPMAYQTASGPDAAWNNMAAAFEPDAPIKDRIAYGVSQKGYPMMADGGAVMKEEGVRSTTFPPLGSELAEGWRNEALFSKAKTKEMQAIQKLRHGGKVKCMADGGKLGRMKVSTPGKITGVGGPTEDKQPILASPGEFIVPADTVQKVGEENLQAMVNATHTPVKQGLRAAANGVIVDDFGNLIDPATGQAQKAVAPAPTMTQQAKSMVGGAANTVTGTAKAGYAKAKKGVKGLRDRMALDKRLQNAPADPFNVEGRRPEITPPKSGSFEIGSKFDTNMKPGERAFAARNIEATQGMMPEGEANRFSRVGPDAARAREVATQGVRPGGFNPAGVRQPGFFERLKSGYNAQGGVSGLGKQVIPDAPGENFQGSEAYKGAGQPGRVARGVRFLGRATPALEAAGQAYTAAEDMPFLTPAEKVQRTGEAFVNTGVAGLGAMAGGAGGAFLGPVGAGAGAIAGGVGGANAGRWLEDKMIKAGIADKPFLASSIAQDRRETQQFLDAKKAEILARQAKTTAVPEAPAAPVAATPTQTAADPAAGFQMPTEDTVAQPSLEDLKRGWASESAAIDARAAAQNRANAQRFHGMRLENEAAQAAYERDRDAGNMSTAHRLAPGRVARALQRDAAAKAALDNFYQGARNEGIAQSQLDTSRLNHQDALAAQKYAADQGLRGHKYTADAGLLARQMSNKLGYLQLQQQIGEKNLGDIEKMITERSQMFTRDKEGKPIADPESSQAKAEAFRRFVMTANTMDPSMLQKRFGVSRVQDISMPQWSAAFDQLQGQLEVAKNASVGEEGKIEGPTRGIRAEKRSLGHSFYWPGSGTKSGVNPIGTVTNWLDPTSSLPENYVATTTGAGGLRTVRPMNDIGTSRAAREAAIHDMEVGGTDPATIAQFRAFWNLN